MSARALAVACLAAFLVVAGAGVGRAAPDAGSTVATALPLLVIQTPGAIRDEPRSKGRLRVVHRQGGTNRPGDRANVYDGPLEIEIRGTTSQSFPKKSYSLELGRETALLGLPRDDDWVLYAAYNDKTLMRNAAAYNTARLLGRYAPRTRHVEVVHNGRYQGVYLLGERPELNKRRIVVNKKGVEGGYLLELTSGDKLKRGDEVFRAPITRKPVIHDEPSGKSLSKKERDYIRAYVGAAERALYAPSFRDPARGWRAYVDEAAAVDFVLVNELFKNQDAFQASTFLHKGNGGKLKLGPVWDFDVSSGNSSFGGSSRLAGWMLAQRRWAERLYGDPAFVAAFERRWRELRRTGVVGRVIRGIDVDARTLRGPQQRNFQRWPVLRTVVWPNPAARGSHAAEVAHLKSWLTRRAAWIDANIGTLGR